MKKLLAIMLAVVMLLGMGTVTVAADEASDIKASENKAWYADYFFDGFTVEYVKNYVCGALVNEEDELFDHDTWTITYASAAVDLFMADHFVFTDEMFAAVREALGYDVARDVYVLPFIGGFGGFVESREYVSYKKNPDGSYTLYYQTIDWLELPQSEYDKLEGLDEWPMEVEYEGKIYENGPEGYLHKAGYKDGGLAHTLDVKNGIARFIATEQYTGNKVPAPKNGWVQEFGKWAYYQNNTKLVKRWMKDSVGWVYLGADGYMLTNRWVEDSVGWCYVGANGYAVTNQWKQDSVGWCYLDANGSMTKSKWLLDGGKWYYLDGNGYMLANKWMKDSTGWVYLGSSGAMLTNRWVKDSVGWCYVGANGYAVTNCWKKDSVGWCYLNSNGSMTKSKWVLDGGKWYYLDGNGYMVANKSLKIGGKTYKFNAAGVCTNP